MENSRKDKNRRNVETIKKTAIEKINSLTDREIQDRVKGLGVAKFSIEATVKMVLGDFAAFVRTVEGFKNGEYENVKKMAVDAVLPIFGQKILEEEKKDLSKIGIAEKRQILIDNVNKQSFNLCQDNAIRDRKPYQQGIIECDGQEYILKRDENNENTIVKLENISGQSAPKPVDQFITDKDLPGLEKLSPLEKISKSPTMKDPHFYDDEEKFVSKFMNNGEPVVVKNDFEFEGPRTCTIRFVESLKQPKLKKPEKYINKDHRIFSTNSPQQTIQYKWIVSSATLAFEEIDALMICFRKNNRQYKLDRKVLQDIINGKTKKKAPEAITLIRSSKRK